MKGEHNSKQLTGKQASFVDKYLGEARFNASLAARLAGYKATSKHSFEAIGSRNLKKPDIRAAIEDYWRMSRMTADECLTELSSLARGDSKDKVRALALLSSHYGLLDGSGAHGGRYGPREPVTLNVVYTNEVTDAINKIYGRDVRGEERAELITDIVRHAGTWHEEANEYNAKVQKHNDVISAIYNDLLERYKDSPDAIAALTELRTRAQASEMSPDDPEAEMTEPILEPEIIPPVRRLQPAAVERLMNQACEQQPVASVVHSNAPSNNGRVKLTGYCQRVDSDEAERIKDRGLRMF